MAWMGTIKSFLGSGTMLSMVGGLIATGSYVVYTDTVRYPNMMDRYARGNILPPLAENDFEVAYFKRRDLETTIRQVLAPTFQNEYFYVGGPVGAGKTRLVVECVRDLIEREGAKGLGAPVYVLVNQGKSFPETLAQAVAFHFDEHVSFRFFVDFVMRIHSIPSKDDDNRLVRVLDAIEKSAFRYMIERGRPVVLVIDGTDSLPQSMPGALERIQEKAKLWADANAVKVVFVNNNEEAELALQKNVSYWSRAAMPIMVGDLSREETIEFLTSGAFMEPAAMLKTGLAPDKIPAPMTSEAADRIYDLVGGRIHHLITFKRNWLAGVLWEDTAETLMDRERYKFSHVSRNPTVWKIVSLLREADERGDSVLLSKLILASSVEGVEALSRCSVIRFDRTKTGMIVRFESRLTQNVVADMERIYQQERQGDSIPEQKKETS